MWKTCGELLFYGVYENEDSPWGITLECEKYHKQFSSEQCVIDFRGYRSGSLDIHIGFLDESATLLSKLLSFYKVHHKINEAGTISIHIFADDLSVPLKQLVEIFSFCIQDIETISSFMVQKIEEIKQTKLEKRGHWERRFLAEEYDAEKAYFSSVHSISEFISDWSRGSSTNKYRFHHPKMDTSLADDKENHLYNTPNYDN